MTIEVRPATHARFDDVATMVTFTAVACVSGFGPVS